MVLIGYQPLDLQVCLQQSSVRHWRTLKADVKAAFLQGDASEEARQLFARPVPELARAMNLKENEMVQVLQSCYGLVTAPAQWYKCCSDTCRLVFTSVRLILVFVFYMNAIRVMIYMIVKLKGTVAPLATSALMWMTF